MTTTPPPPTSPDSTDDPGVPDDAVTAAHERGFAAYLAQAQWWREQALAATRAHQAVAAALLGFAGVALAILMGGDRTATVSGWPVVVEAIGLLALGTSAVFALLALIPRPAQAPSLNLLLTTWEQYRQATPGPDPVRLFADMWLTSTADPPEGVESAVQEDPQRPRGMGWLRTKIGTVRQWFQRGLIRESQALRAMDKRREQVAANVQRASLAMGVGIVALVLSTAAGMLGLGGGTTPVLDDDPGVGTTIESPQPGLSQTENATRGEG